MMKWPEWYRNGITMTSRERHVGSSHRPFDCLIISLCGPTSKKHQRLHYWPFVRGIRLWPVKSPQKGQLQLTRKKLPFEDVIGARFEFVIKWGTHTIICFSIHIIHIKYIISIRELLNHNCCVKKLLSNSDQPGLTPKHSVSQTPHQPGKDLWWLPGLFLFPLCLKMQL